MTNHETANQPPAHWPEELRAAFWTAVNAATYDESAAATLALTQGLAALIRSHPGAIPYRPQLDEDGGFWWDTRDRDAAADLIDPTRTVPAAVSVPPPATRADASCVCGEPEALSTVHRTDGPCHTDDRREAIALAIARVDAGKWGTDVPLREHPMWQVYLAYGEAVIAMLTSTRKPELRRLAAVSAPCVAGEQQNETPEAEAHPPHHRWMVETRDDLAEEWAPGMRFTDRAEAVARYQTVSELYPEWRDGTPVQRRFVRETTSYTVEAPE